jgi:hypothetical protein
MARRRSEPAHDEAQACLDCECCAAWAEGLATLKEHALRHLRGEIRFAPCHPDCLICAEVDWMAL